MNNSDHNSPAQLSRILWGEASVDVLTDPLEHAQVQRSLAALHAAVAIKPLDREQLRETLRRADARSATQRLNWKRRYLFAAATVLLAFGLVLYRTWPAIQQTVFNRIQQKPRELPVAPQFTQSPEGMWQLPGVARVMPSRADQIKRTDEGVMRLDSGRADIVSEGTPGHATPLLTAVNNRLRLAVNGPSKSSVRLLPDNAGLALSVYAGDPSSVRIEEVGTKVACVGGAHVDALIMPGDGPGKSKMIYWMDVRATIPPVNEGVVCLRLANGRLIRGTVARSSTEGILLSAVPQGTDSGPAISESILARDIVGWVPAATPRGRDTYAAWLAELLPTQLRDAKREWLMYIATKEVAPEQILSLASILAKNARYPDVDYGVGENGNNLNFFARPNAADLGPGWSMDEHGEVTREGTKKREGQEF